MRTGKFQIHLGTAIVLFLMAAFLLWRNCRVSHTNDYGYGWPLCAVEMRPFQIGDKYEKVNPIGVVFDLGFAVTTLSGLAYVCEQAFLRRAAKSSE